MPLFHLQERAPWPPPPTDVVGKTVPPVAGTAAGIAVDAALDDDVGASATSGDSRAPTAPLSGVAEGTVPLVVGADCCGFSNRENIDISTFSD